MFILVIIHFLNAHLCPKNLIRPKMFQSWLNIWLNISWYWLIIEFESHFWPMAIALRPKYGVLVSKNILSLDHLDIFDHFGHLSVWVRKKQGLPIFFCLQRTANSNIFISNIQYIRQNRIDYSRLLAAFGRKRTFLQNHQGQQKKRQNYPFPAQ